MVSRQTVKAIRPNLRGNALRDGALGVLLWLHMDDGVPYLFDFLAEAIGDTMGMVVGLGQGSIAWEMKGDVQKDPLAGLAHAQRVGSQQRPLPDRGYRGRGLYLATGRRI